MRYAFTIATVIGALAPALAVAQQADVESMYQKGAGAYFAGHTDQAETHLSTVIESTPNDPRAYYLRGLNRLTAGDTKGAQSDLSVGARLEAERGSASPLVDRSLAAVQGSSRMMLERIRRAARESAEVEARRSVALAQKKAREEREQLVLRTKYQLPIESLASRLSVAQARKVALKERLGGSTLATSSALASAPPGAVDEPADNNPFVDDPRDMESLVASTEPSAPTVNAEDTNSVDVPDAARGSMKVGQLLSIFGGFGRDATASVGDTVTGLAPPGVIPGGPAPGFPGLAPGGDFGPEDGQFPAEGNFGSDPDEFGDGDSTENDQASPFDFDE